MPGDDGLLAGEANVHKSSLALQGLSDKASALCRALGYVGSPTYYETPGTFDRDENAHVVRTAFGAVGIHSMFGLSDGGAVSKTFKPVIYVGVALDASEADALHRRVWTQGVVPLLVVVTPAGVEVRNAFGPPTGSQASIRFDSAEGALPEALQGVTARSLTTSIYWKDRHVSRAGAIDTRLVSAIEALNRHACAEYPHLATRTGRALVNALVGRMIYLYVLIDRRLIDTRWMRGAIEAAGCPGSRFAEAAVLRGVRVGPLDFDAAEVWAVLDGIDAAINGCVFPIRPAERRLIPDDLVLLVHDVVRWGVEVEGRQLSFLDVSFEILRTETISAIYERFLRIEDDAAQRAEGAFYTPPYLADFVLARVDGEKSLDVGSRIVDAAAGSGVFLVSAYRRIMERSAPPGGWGPDGASAARRILRECVFGIEKNPQAANVCRFSLYLTMLDYVAGGTLERLVEGSGSQKLLPSLEGNIVVASAFSNPFGEARFTHVVGNPPWLRLMRRGSRRNVRIDPGSVPTEVDASSETDDALIAFMSGLGPETPVMHGRLSDAFLWLAAERLAEDDGVIGLILPTTSLAGRQSGRFGSALARRLTVRSVANLSYLRYNLFAGAKAPTTVVTACKRPSHPSDKITVYRPRLTSLPLDAFRSVWALLISQTDLQTVHARDLQGDSNGWFAPLILGTVDRRMRSALRTLSRRGNRTVGGFLERSGLSMARGGNDTETGFVFPEKQMGTGKMVKANLVPLPRGPGPKVTEAYRGLFSGNMLLVPRNFRNPRLLRDPYAFNSSFYGVTFTEGGTNDRRQVAFEALGPDERAECLESLGAFLGSGIVRYLASLYGATVTMDGARLEKGDLLAMPCPFDDVRDPAFLGLRRSTSVDAAILDALNAGEDLRKSLSEFETFTKGYADASMPSTAFAEVGDDELASYVGRFQRELDASFTDRLEPTVAVAGRCHGIVSLRIAFGGARASGRRTPDTDGTFVASSLVSFDRDARLGFVRKTTARFGWTSDQAVEDANELVRLVASGRG